jgi:hypothetical protein
MATNADLFALTSAALLLLLLLLWRSDGPPALLAIACGQWLQGSMKIYDAELRGVPLRTLSLSHSVEAASAMTILWSLAMALGMAIAVRGVKVARVDPRMGVRGALVVYLLWSALLPAASFILPWSARQILIALADLRWATVFVLYVLVLSSGRGWSILALSLAVETALGFLSFFSDFKTVLTLLLIGLLSSGRKLRLVHLLGAVVTAIAMLYLATLWTAIKREYRSSLNAGSGEQVVVIDKKEQAQELSRLVGDVDRSSFDQAIDNLVDRIAYVDYFAYTMDFVPGVRPHENGRMWEAAIRHVLLPRVFYPDKPALPDDTEIAERYTGLNLSTPGTSITIGLPAETYVDFGFPGMLVPALILGILYGFACRVLVTRPLQPYGYGMIVAIALKHMYLGASAPKTLGSLLTLAIVGLIMWFQVLPRMLAFSLRWSTDHNQAEDRSGRDERPDLSRS